MLHHIQEELHAELKLLHQIYFFFHQIREILHETSKFLHQIRNVLHQTDGSFGLPYFNRFRWCKPEDLPNSFLTFYLCLCNFIEITLLHGCSLVHLLHIFWEHLFLGTPLDSSFCIDICWGYNMFRFILNTYCT